jgi:CRP-like cAMP-binding protein
MIALPDEPPERQASLFSRATARATDPETSHLAAASVDADKLEVQVLDYLRYCRHLGATSHEIAAGLGLSLVTVSPRLRPLQRHGLAAWARDADGHPIRRKGAGHRVASQVWVAGEFA